MRSASDTMLAGLDATLASRCRGASYPRSRPGFSRWRRPALKPLFSRAVRTVAWNAIRGWTSWNGWPISCRHRGSTGIAITGCSPRVTSSGPPSRRWPSGMSASRVMPRPVGMPSADMRHAEMPPATAATHATNRPPTTPPGSRGPNSWPAWGRSFHSSALGCGGDIRLRGSGRQEPAHFEPEVRKRKKARMASPA